MPTTMSSGIRGITTRVPKLSSVVDLSILAGLFAPADALNVIPHRHRTPAPVWDDALPDGPQTSGADEYPQLNEWSLWTGNLTGRINQRPRNSVPEIR